MACPVCLNADTPTRVLAQDRFFEATTRTFTLRTCGHCQSLFIDPLPDAKDLATFYPPQYWWDASPSLLKTCESFYRRMVLRGHVACITRAASSVIAEAGHPLRLLDVGCGGGTLLAVLKRRGFEVLGFDSSADAMNIAWTRSGVPVVTAESVKDAGFPSGAFDLVTLFHVMEHTPEPRTILAEVQRILQPRGRVLVQVPNIESWQSRLCGPRWYGLDVPRHVINYSSHSIQGLLSNCGFRIRRTRHFNLRDNAAALASSVCPGLDPVSRRARLMRRNRRESSMLAWIKNLAYLGVVAAGYPLILAESVCGAGGTVMLEAEKV
jgi:SAM-dependent methyltransferase